MLEALVAGASLLVSIVGWLIGARAKSLGATSSSGSVNSERSKGSTAGATVAAVAGAILFPPMGAILGAKIGAIAAVGTGGERLDPVAVVEARLSEARIETEQQLRLANAHRISNLLLMSAQFIVGGLLASSFVQEALHKSVIGVLGLLVLTSSLIRQYYKPEVELAAARERAARLRSVVREVEDSLLLRVPGQFDVAAAGDLASRVRTVLAEVEVEVAASGRRINDRDSRIATTPKA